MSHVLNTIHFMSVPDSQDIKYRPLFQNLLQFSNFTHNIKARVYEWYGGALVPQLNEQPDPRKGQDVCYWYKTFQII